MLSSAIFTVLSCALTILIPNITTVFSVVGGIGCVAISYLIPLLAYLAVFKDETFKPYAFIVIGALISAIGVGSAINGVLR
ncbi:MAG: hypothetical protein P4M11_07815 [Candidatus Pacebacteria bacterium]|nr:hypothetical protein [Candidatus Paceibacterota bacterium]